MSKVTPALDFFADFISKNLGIQYSQENYFQLERRLETIAKQMGVEGIIALWDLAKGGMPGQMKLLILDSATNNETSFFRDPAVFTGIQQVLETEEFLPSGKPIHIWSAAASTGQEIYSIRMILDELAPKYPNANFKLFATDYSERVLTRAKKGTYSQLEVQRGLGTPRLLKYFDKVPTEVEGAPAEWQIKPALQEGIHFGQQNLVEPFVTLPNFHIILCRNVLLYQPIENKRSIVANLIRKLELGGYFIMGGAESLVGLDSELRHVSFGKSVFYQKQEQQSTTTAA